MAPMSGVDLLNEIRRNTDTKRPSFILMSAQQRARMDIGGQKGGGGLRNHETVQRWHVEDKISQLGSWN
jgi:hypothetical protein